MHKKPQRNRISHISRQSFPSLGSYVLCTYIIEQHLVWHENILKERAYTQGKQAET
jgi:hypothetical protein